MSAYHPKRTCVTSQTFVAPEGLFCCWSSHFIALQPTNATEHVRAISDDGQQLRAYLFVALERVCTYASRHRPRIKASA
jgi:hypothetical protein